MYCRVDSGDFGFDRLAVAEALLRNALGVGARHPLRDERIDAPGEVKRKLVVRIALGARAREREPEGPLHMDGPALRTRDATVTYRSHVATRAVNSRRPRGVSE